MNLLSGAAVALRADASLTIGTGHVMRCLTLAAALRERGAHCRFVTRAHPGHLAEAIRSHGFDSVLLPMEVTTVASAPAHTAHDGWLGSDLATDARRTAEALRSSPVDWLVVDHYALDATWESALRSHAGRILAIDDLADRPHDCELLLDQNLGRQASDYVDLVPLSCRVLAGPAHALLRPEFAELRPQSLARREQGALEHLLVSMGGVDLHDASGVVLDALRGCRLPQSVRISVVMGSGAPALDAVRARAADMPWATEVLVDISEMAELMADCDLAIGAAGSTSWERCCLGLPSIVVTLADNQLQVARRLQSSGAAFYLDMNADFACALHELIAHLMNHRELLPRMSGSARQIVDGGGCRRVVVEIDQLR